MEEKKHHIIIIMIILLIVAGIVIGTYTADVRARIRAGKRAETVLMDSAKDQAYSLAFSLIGSFQTLETLGVALSDVTADAAETSEMLEQITNAASLHFAGVDFIYPNGQQASADEEFDLNVSDRNYFNQALAGRRSMEKITGRKTGKPCVALAVPCYKGSEVIGVLRGTFYAENLGDLIRSQAYSGSGNTILICSHGDIIVEDLLLSTEGYEGNIFNLLAEAEFAEGYSLDSLESNLREGKSSIIRYSHKGSFRVAALTPLGNNIFHGNSDSESSVSAELPANDWYIYNLITEVSFYDEIDESRRDSVESMLILFVFSTAALMLFWLLESDYRKKQQLEREIARQREEQFRIVTEQSEKFVLRYDINTKTGYQSEISESADSFESLNNVSDFSEEAIRRGFIDPSGEDDFRTFFIRISRGESPVTAEILTVYGQGKRRWLKFVSTTIFDKTTNLPRTAVISYFDNTEQRQRELAYAKWQLELGSIPFERAALYEWNLTKDEQENARGRLVTDYDMLSANTFNARTDYFIANRVIDEDRIIFASLMNREHLMGMYLNGKYEDSAEYRYIEGDGSIRWRKVSVQLVPYPESNEIKAYVTNMDIDEEKREQLAALEASQRDFLTGAFNRETFIKKVTEVFSTQNVSKHALFMLDLDGFKMLNDKLGHDRGDEILISFVAGMRSVLRSNDIIGRIGGDEFMAFLTGIPDRGVIERKASQLCNVLYRRLPEGLNVSASIGIAVYPRDGEDFEALYHSADTALYAAKNRGKNSYCFFEQGMSIESVTAPAAPAPTEEPAPKAETTEIKYAVAVASNSQATYLGLYEMLSEKYEVIRLSSEKAEITSPHRPLAGIILDTDTPLGSIMIHSRGREMLNKGLYIFALTSDKSAKTYLSLSAGGASLIVYRPLNPQIILKAMENACKVTDANRREMQKNLTDMMAADERQYKEVLSATGTLAIIYDVPSASYTSNMLNALADETSLSIFDLSRRMIENKTVGASDMESIVKAVGSVKSGEMKKVSLTLHLTTDNHLRWSKIQIIALRVTQGKADKLLITVNDINEQIELELSLRLRAERDALTGLYNRETFLEKCRALIGEMKAGYYLMECIDIDNFKVLNDRYGLEKGDEVLKFVAGKIMACFEAQQGICARMSADNFAVLYPLKYKDSALSREALFAAKRPDESLPVITFSIGRYVVEDKELTVSSMFDRATLAANSVKGRYDGHVADYDESMRNILLKEQEITDEMKSALAQGQFELWFQPQYDHTSDTLIGSEALIRWRHPQKGLLLPGEYIPIFEKNGFIYEADKFVWESACKLLRGWIDDKLEALPVSVNVSRYDLWREDFYEFITSLIEKYSIPIYLLRLEITESVFAGPSKGIIELVKKLVDYGFTIEIDDFGSGYSSLNTLKDVPADILKLDMRFLEGGEDTPRSGKILESIVAMATKLGMTVIAEGVEHKWQADYLVSIGCRYIQGFYYYSPMPLGRYEELLVNNRPSKQPRGQTEIN